MKYITCLPKSIGQAVDVDGIEEIRLRRGQPVKVMRYGSWYYVENGKLHLACNNPIYVDENMCNEVLQKACLDSVFAYEQQLLQGFFVFSDGVRVGISAKVSLTESGKHNISSLFGLCFRVPNKIDEISKGVFDKIGICNLLVVGKVNSGKTTFLRDYALQCAKQVSTLVVDERGELNVANCFSGDLNVDVISMASKQYSFEVGTRVLSPTIVATDELSLCDFEWVKLAQSRGVKVVSTIHGDNLGNLFELLKEYALAFDYVVKIDRFADNFAKLYCFNTKHELI